MSQYKNTYRKLLRTAIYVFGEDYKMIGVARKTMKEEFRKNQHVTDAAALKECYSHADDAEQMLRFHILQGVKNEKGNFQVKFKPEHQVAIQAGQDLPHGPEITPIDRSYVGEEVLIEKVKVEKHTHSSDCKDKHCH